VLRLSQAGFRTPRRKSREPSQPSSAIGGPCPSDPSLLRGLADADSTCAASSS
jgi:hypothetical protein